MTPEDREKIAALLSTLGYRLDGVEPNLDRAPDTETSWVLYVERHDAVIEATNGWFNVFGICQKPIPRDVWREVAVQGHRDPDAITHWVRVLNFTVDRDLAVAYLKEYGAWTVEEMVLETDNWLARTVLWVACCDLKEHGEWIGLVH